MIFAQNLQKISIFRMSYRKSFLGSRNLALQFLNFLGSLAPVSYRPVSYKKKTCKKFGQRQQGVVIWIIISYRHLCSNCLIWKIVTVTSLLDCGSRSICEDSRTTMVFHFPYKGITRVAAHGHLKNTWLWLCSIFPKSSKIDLNVRLEVTRFPEKV